jgi:two-component system, sensor histidine kinase and response regulator
MSTPHQILLDRQVALTRVGGDLELLREIAALFLETYPEALHELHCAVDSGDAKALERSAHGLKGSVSNFGAAAAVEAAKNLEDLGRAHRMETVADGLRNLERALEALHPELVALQRS